MRHCWPLTYLSHNAITFDAPEAVQLRDKRTANTIVTKQMTNRSTNPTKKKRPSTRPAIIVQQRRNTLAPAVPAEHNSVSLLPSSFTFILRHNSQFILFCSHCYTDAGGCLATCPFPNSGLPATRIVYALCVMR